MVVETKLLLPIFYQGGPKGRGHAWLSDDVLLLFSERAADQLINQATSISMLPKSVNSQLPTIYTQDSPRSSTQR